MRRAELLRVENKLCESKANMRNCISEYLSTNMLGISSMTTICNSTGGRISGRSVTLARVASLNTLRRNAFQALTCHHSAFPASSFFSSRHIVYLFVGWFCTFRPCQVDGGLLDSQDFVHHWSLSKDSRHSIVIHWTDISVLIIFLPLTIGLNEIFRF